MTYYRVVDDVQVEMTSEEIADFLAQAPPSVPVIEQYRLYKSVFINRMTDAEAASMETVLVEVSAKMRLMFNSVEYFISDDPLFNDLKAAIETTLGITRATELLANEPS